MFGFHSSEQKKHFIEEEFRKRQLKRQGKDPNNPHDDAAQGDDAYSAILNNPEFAKVFSDLIAEKGLGSFANDVPMLLEYLKSTISPESLRSFFHVEGHGDQVQVTENVPYNSIPTALSEVQLEHPAMFEVGIPTALELQTSALPELAGQSGIVSEQPMMIHSMPATAQIPRLNVALDTAAPPPMVAIPPPAPPPLLPIPAPETAPIAPITPIAPIPAVPNRVQPTPPPPRDRIRAFGFPPMMQSR